MERLAKESSTRSARVWGGAFGQMLGVPLFQKDDSISSNIDVFTLLFEPKELVQWRFLVKLGSNCSSLQKAVLILVQYRKLCFIECHYNLTIINIIELWRDQPFIFDFKILVISIQVQHHNWYPDIFRTLWKESAWTHRCYTYQWGDLPTHSPRPPIHNP